MIKFNDYGIDYDAKKDFDIVTKDLIAISNIKTQDIDTVVLDDNIQTVKIDGKYKIKNRYAVIGGEIIYINNYNIPNNENYTELDVTRELKGTTRRYWKGYKIRTVELIGYENTDTDLLDWSFTDTTGSPTSTLFPVELGSGNISISSDLSLWSPHSNKQKFKVRNRKSIVYIFKGLQNKRFLKFTTLITKLGVSSSSKNSVSKIKLDIKTILAKWYDKDLSINKQLKGTTPKEMFKLLFDLNDDDVYYVNGVSDDSFLKINNLHTKEYKKMSELLKAYCSNGVRFCFDRYEKVKIFADFKIDNIESSKTVYEDLTEATMTEDEAMIYNTISTQSVQRQTMFNFEDMDNKYVYYSKVLKNAIKSNIMLKMDKDNVVVQGIEIVSEEMFKHVQLGDLVCFKRTVAPFLELYAKIVAKKTGNIINISTIVFDKDFRLFPRGKDKYLYNILNNNVCDMDLYYVRQELPMVFKFTRNKNGEEKDSSLMYPLLPRIDGKTTYEETSNITFGCASNLKVGSYTGIIEEVGKIYGTWDKTSLFYNRELDQFDNINSPPIFVLSNKVSEKQIDEKTFIINYDTFDNEHLLVEFMQPTDTSCDAILKLSNSSSISSSNLFKSKELSRKGNLILEVENIKDYQIGDVLITNKPDDLTEQEEMEYDEVLSSIRWTITGKFEDVLDAGVSKHYIQLNSKFAKRQKRGKVYEFTKFPNSSIVYLQELYIRGNPLLEYSQDIVGISRGVNYDGERSRDLYGEKKYEFDSKQLSKDNMRKMMGYILDHFDATTVNTTKFNVPISVFNGVDIELLDVISVIDPNGTQMNQDQLWVVLSIMSKLNTNTVQLKLLNVNATNTKPFKIDVKDVLEYKPVEIPTYDHVGGEGNTQDNNDGNGGSGVDKTIGIFHMGEVDPKIFRAVVDRYENGYIYFKEFAGTEWETYSQKLFPESEFGVSIGGVTFLVHSDKEYRAYIRKKDIYNTGDEIIISPEMNVKFLLMSSFTDIDGTFYSRRCHIGDGDTYFEFHPLSGAKFKGDFTVGESNKNSANDLWQSMQNNRTFERPTPPFTTEQYTIKEGDLWYDTDDNNHLYRYNGNAWVSCRDNSVISKLSSSFIDSEPPTEKIGRPLNNGDTWYDSDDGFRPYVYRDGEWIDVTNENLEKAIDNAQKDATEAMNKLSDIASDNKLTASEKQETLKEINEIKIEYQKLKNESSKFGVNISTYTNAYNTLINYTTPLLSNINTTSNINGNDFRNKFNAYYTARMDVINGITTAVKGLADNAQKDATEALGNAKIFYRPTAPTSGMKENDLWFNTKEGNKPYIYNGHTWISAQDQVFETEGGNKVFFQNNQPPTNSKTSKEGDIWFDTDANNKMYILIGSPLQWKLADDALDKINTGKITLNGNTTVNGDFRVKGGNVELNGSTKIYGMLAVYGGSTGIVTYNGTTEANSTRKTMLTGGELSFWERV